MNEIKRARENIRDQERWVMSDRDRKSASESDLNIDLTLKLNN
jgi:hypothetical protein